MEKDLKYIELFEIYQGLLTERQRELFLSHYYYDLSLAEIAEPSGNTRQSVYASIKAVKNKLCEYESLLKIRERNQRFQDVANEIRDKDKETYEKIISVIGE